MAKIWFILGASGGFGRKCTELALAGGDKVVAAARRVYLLDDLQAVYGNNLLPLALDATNPTDVKNAVQRAIEAFGCIDVLLNSIGISYYAPVEELSSDRVRAVMEANYWGPFNLIQAVLPYMRARRGGHIIQITSIDGVITFPLVGAYGASKWALESLLETLSLEVDDFGIKVSIVEPGPFSTDLHKLAQYEPKPLPAYEGSRQAHLTQMKEAPFKEPEILARGIMRLAKMENPPLRAVSDREMFALIRQAYEKRLREWAVLEEL